MEFFYCYKYILTIINEVDSLKETNVQMEVRMKTKWEKDNTFQRSIENREGKEKFVFYEGPPTANGLPHAGHALGRTIKDFVARYKTMAGYQVIRKAGWDTHGLPVELEVEKQLNIKGKDEIEEYGVENFIEKCKESVFTYEAEWKQFTEKLGYWVDMDDPYITLENEYIESVWNILADIHHKGHLYKGHRVVPYCPQCETSLSSHEVAQGYKDVSDLSATAKFRLKDKENEFFLGWTTTPWTLPGNVAIAVNAQMNYVRVKQGEEVYIVAESLVDDVMKEAYESLEVVKGEDLVGLAYEAPFDFATVENGHKIIAADFVTDTSGTGLVHIAPAHGEDDYHAINEVGFDYINVVDTKGRYKDDITPLAGQFVKDCDVEIIRMLAASNLLFDKEKYEHSYPHCWRCDSPLLYYAMEGWFIKTTAVKEKMQENNQEVEWYPEHMKDGRFGNFLDNMVDWNIGRNRYWGTPLNVWTCRDCDEEKAPASLQELRELSTEPLADDFELHKPFVDKVHLNCACGGVMDRTSEVIDVWFDSGAMPFAQYHYPFENEELFKQQYPADVVIEGVDQTRGWFYSLMAVSTLFTGETPYKRVLSLGHILDENGQKMSKSKGNALDPVALIDEFGADALRWALLADSSPWNNKRFSKNTIIHAKKVIDTLQNVYSFYNMYAEIDSFNPETDLGGTPSTLDDWILSRLHTTIKEVRVSVDDYDITRGARQIASLVEELSNWYVRRSRERFWSSGMSDDKRAAFTTLYDVLTHVTKLLAPFTPFMTDDIHTNLVGESVHLADYPEFDQAMINTQLEADMDAVLEIIEQTRAVRNAVQIKTKQPLSQLLVVPKGEVGAKELEKYTPIIVDEMNVKEVIYQTSSEEFLSYNFKLNFAVAGPKLGKAVGQAKQKVENLSEAEKTQFLEKEQLTVTLPSGEDVTLTMEEVIVESEAKDAFELADGANFQVLLNTELTEALKDEGLVREFVRAVQSYRKELDLPVEQRVDLYVETDVKLQAALVDFEALIDRNLILNALHFETKEDMKAFNIEGIEVKLYIAS